MVLASYCGLQSSGTYLAVVFPDDAPPLLVRVIEYTFTDPAVPGSGQMHRLVTTLLNPQTAPALELVQLYHERWEIEVSIDELDTHQRLAGGTRSRRTPEGVLQEVYGLLLAHYAIRALMHDSALQADVDLDRLSFTQAVQVL